MRHCIYSLLQIMTSIALFAFANCTFAQSNPKPENLVEGFSIPRLNAIGEDIRADIKENKLPGAVIMVARNGRLVYADTIGKQDPKTNALMRSNTIFRLYSMTKPIVSVAVMMMVEEGRVLMTDPISKYIPELKNLKVGIEKIDANGVKALELVPPMRAITIQDLLRHTAGLTYGFQGKSLVKDEYNRLGIERGGHSSLEFIQKLASVPLQYQPGTNWDYSVATDVLGVMLERLSGQSLEEHLAQRIFIPLGMKDSGFWVEPTKQDRIAEAYEIDPVFKVKVPLTNIRNQPKFFSGGGGAVSTADDYLRFTQMLINGGELDGARIVSRKTIEYMLSDQLVGVRAAISPNKNSEAIGPRPGYSFGLGFAVRLDGGEAGTLGTVGSGDWNGLSGPHFWIDPQEKLAVVWMAAAPGARAYYRQLIPNRVYGALMK